MTYAMNRVKRDNLEIVQSKADAIPRTMVDVCDLAAAGESCRSCKHFRARVLTPCRCTHKNKPVAWYNICEFWKGK